MILVYTTCKDGEEAKAIGRLMIEARLAVSVNMWPIEALYGGADGVGETTGYAVLIQTLETKLQAIEDLVTEHRPHATPFIGAVNVSRINRAFKERASDILR
jgi:uncharacterized protein involved in tolerance to divalent cations